MGSDHGHGLCHVMVNSSTPLNCEFGNIVSFITEALIWITELALDLLIYIIILYNIGDLI